MAEEGRGLCMFHDLRNNSNDTSVESDSDFR